MEYLPAALVFSVIMLIFAPPRRRDHPYSWGSLVAIALIIFILGLVEW
jgi:hypothetical protein